MKIQDWLRKNKKRFLAIDFGQIRTTIAYFESSAGNLRLLAYESERLTTAAEKLKEAIVDFINTFVKVNSVSEKDVTISIADADSIAIKYIILPDLPENEIFEAAKWQLQEEVQFNLKVALCDFQIARQYSDKENARKKGIIFIAVEKSAIDSYVEIAERCGLHITRISHPAFNYANALPVVTASNSTVAVLDIKYKDTMFCTYHNNRLCFVRKIPVSWEKLIQCLTGTLITDKGKIALSSEEAERIMTTFGIPQDGTQVIKDNILGTHIISFVRPILEILTRDIKFSFNYFVSNLEMEQPAAIYLSGFGAGLKNLDNYLSSELKLPVSVLTLPEKIDTRLLDQQKLKEEQGIVVRVMGSVLTAGGSINLLPFEIKTRKIEYLQKSTIRLTAIALAAVFLFLLSVAKLQIYDYKKRLKNARMHLQAVGEISTLKNKIDARSNLKSIIQKDMIPADGLLRLMSSIIPQEVILDELIFEQENRFMTIKGKVFSVQETANGVLVNFINRLEGSLFVSKANLVYSKRLENSEEFELKCDLPH